MVFKEHGLRLYMDKRMLARFQKYIGDKGLGRSYGGLKLLAIGLREEAYLTEGEFEAYAERYSVTLEEAVSKPAPKLTSEDLKAQEQKNQLAKAFSGALSQWATLSEKSRAYHIKKAEENPTVPNAKLVMALSQNGNEEKKVTAIE